MFENLVINTIKKLNNDITFRSIEKLITSEGYSIMIAELKNDEILAHTMVDHKKIVINIKLLGGKKLDCNLSIFILLHEYFHILEQRWDILYVPDKTNRVLEQADVFAKIIMNLFNINPPL